MTDITELARRVEHIISDMKLKHGDKDTYAPVMKWDEFLALVEALEKAQKRISQLESRTVKLPEPFKLAKSSSGLTYYYADEVDAALTAAGIKVEAE
ncbi:hypothetical protein AAHV58_06485 [Klebsiella pneumoniae]|uniref:hypothetical protein n=1 Tax=Klebsiella pneumoniae complex TaxID=3390273 RepID=UPI000E2AB367|nr:MULTISPECIES: hypothetical protein [Klebsiella]HCD6353368.1 hypothetical protein [Klebsiella variicola]MDD7845119.1 hypothetical protein [Klebsiella quasipneumoniae]MDD7860079.1 hypothetical protein [Klebsiella quasipneumoniae]MDF8306655.1 hypothetical protein [Klebsiella quasipneumoniae]SYU58267.1 RelE family toxin-antitoxin system [Klebsiella pneumoniae]